MKKKPFVTKEQLQEIVKQFPTPFHLYDEKGIRANAQAVREAFAWNKGYREYFAVKAEPNPFIIQILKEYGCGCDCSSMTELMLSDALGIRGEQIMFSSNNTPAEEFQLADRLGAVILFFWNRRLEKYRKPSAAAIIRAGYTKSATALWITRRMQNTALQKNSCLKAAGY